MKSRRRPLQTFEGLLLLLVICVVYCRCSRNASSFASPGAAGRSLADDETKSTAIAETSRQERFLVNGDMVMQLVMQNMDSVPEHFRGPLMFAMGFAQQNMKNFMSNMRSLGQMIISSVVMMALKKFFFADLPTEADRNKAGKLTDAIMNLVNLVL